MTVKITDFNGFPGNSASHSEGKMKMATRLIQPPEFLDDAVYNYKGDMW